jgi:hypothetical protein
VWENIGASSSVLLHLLSPLPGLLHPSLDTASASRVLLVFGDLHRLFSGATGKKLAFYSAAMEQIKRAEWLSLEREMQAEIRRLERELRDAEGEDPKLEGHSQLLI